MERLPSTQDVKGTQSQHGGDFVDGDHGEMSAPASKNLKPHARKIIKQGQKDVYGRIWQALRKLQNHRGVAMVNVETLIYIVQAAYPDHPRPKVCEIEGAVVWGQYVGLLKRRTAFGHADGVVIVKFLEETER